jgi:hypothetical protein
VTLHPFSEVTELGGDPYLRMVTWRDWRTGETETRAVEG